MLPERGPFSLWAQSANQILIFSPMIVLLIACRQRPETAWVRRDRVAVRIGTGMLLAALALAAFAASRGGVAHWPVLAGESLDLSAHLDELVQVFLEDLTIAIVVVRLAAASRRQWIPPVAVGVLFAAGHIPAMLSGGKAAEELFSLVLDAGLAIGVIAVVQRSADIWWFWIVHYSLDMTQYVDIAPVN